jgi:thiol-disulfide isomerase/thioredoxin
MRALAIGAVLLLFAGAHDGGVTARAASTGTHAALPDEVRDINGNRLSAVSLRGRVILLDFWARWCAPCLSELPRLKELRAGYPRDDFEIVGVMLEGASRRTLVSWLNRHRIDWPQVQERGGYSGGLATRFGVQSLPATVLFDRDGTVAATGLRGDALAARVDELVARPRVPTIAGGME